MAWTSPGTKYQISVPQAGGERDVGESEVQKWTDVAAFIADATPLLNALAAGSGAGTFSTDEDVKVYTGTTEPLSPAPGDVWIDTSGTP